jgi:hypothetical protein
MERSDIFFRDAITCVMAFALGIFLPFPTLLLVHLIGYSEVVEELVKGVVVIFLLSRLSTTRRQLLWTLIFGFLFGLSEALFYLAQYVAVGTVENFWTRFVTTIPLHAFLSLIVMIPIILGRARMWGVLGVLLAIGVHLAFNHFAAGLI